MQVKNPGPKALPRQPSELQTGQAEQAEQAQQARETTAAAPLTAVDGHAAAAVARQDGADLAPQAAAVAELKSVIKHGQLPAYFDAAIGVSDDPALKERALRLFDSLPALQPNTDAQALVDLGLWTTAPRGIEHAKEQARYRPGTEVVVSVPVNNDPMAGDAFLAYDADGVKMNTHRAKLVGEDGDRFLVQVDGRDEPLAVPKTEVFEANQPTQLVMGSGPVRVDYDSPLMKAKLAEAALALDDIAASLDLAKPHRLEADGAIGVLFGKGRPTESTADLQREALRKLHKVADMKYPTARARGEAGRHMSRDAGRLLTRGMAVGFQQAAAMEALIAPFEESLGIETRRVHGGVLRNLKPGHDAEQRARVMGQPNHSWLEVRLRPSMERAIADPTWQHPAQDVDKAYSRYGDRYPISAKRWAPDVMAPVGDGDVAMAD